jgi:hypothetical protein
MPARTGPSKDHEPRGINTWNESGLHEALKERYRGEGGATEVALEGVVCDVVRADGTVVEIQTRGLGRLKGKLVRLLADRPVRLVFPVARDKILETRTPSGRLKSRRRSPKHESKFAVFAELTGLWPLLDHPGLVIEVVHVDVLETRVDDGKGSWRRRGVRIAGRELVAVHGADTFRGLADWARLVPPSLPAEFTVKELAAAAAGGHAGRMAWTLRHAGVLALCGKRGNALVYRLVPGWSATPVESHTL